MASLYAKLEKKHFKTEHAATDEFKSVAKAMLNQHFLVLNFI